MTYIIFWNNYSIDEIPDFLEISERLGCPSETKGIDREELGKKQLSKTWD